MTNWKEVKIRRLKNEVKIRIIKVNKNNDLNLSNLFVKINIDGKIVDLSKNLLLMLNEKACEHLWNVANKIASNKSKCNGWRVLGKIVGQSYNSLRQKNERKRAKPFIVYARLIKFLENKNIRKYNFDWLQKNLKRIQWLKSSRAEKIHFPTSWCELGMLPPNPIRVKIETIEWEDLHKKSRSTLHLKNLLKKVRFKNPYFGKTNTKYKSYQEIGPFYEIDFSSAIWILPNEKIREKLWALAINNCIGRNKITKLKNLARIIGSSYGAIRSKRFRSRAKPLLVYYKLLKFLQKNSYNYDLDFLEKNLKGISRGSGQLLYIRFPIKWTTKEGVIFLTSLVGDGGLAFRSDFDAWAAPYYSQEKHTHPELKKILVRAVNKLFDLNFNENINKRSIEWPVILGYLVVVSGYLQPGNKIFTKPDLPIRNMNKRNVITAFNWLLCDDGSVSKQGNVKITGGTGTKAVQPYLIQLADGLKDIIPQLKYRTDFKTNKKGVYHDLQIIGGRLVLENLYNFIKKYNGKIFAEKKNENIREYFSSFKTNREEYINRYANRKFPRWTEPKILNLLKKESLSSKELSMRLGSSHNAISKHLIKLKKNGFVDYKETIFIIKRTIDGKILKTKGPYVRWFLVDKYGHRL